MLNNFASTQQGGSGTVTTTTILDGTIANADVASDAAIDVSKINFGNTLEIETSSGDQIFEMDNNASNSTNFQIQNGAGNARTDFYLDGSAILTLKNQMVGIGDTSPSYALDVNTTGRFTTDLIVGGNLTIGDGGAEDQKVVFNGNAQDFYVGLDDSADDLLIGLGSAVGTTPAISINADRDVTISDGAIDFDVASHDTSNGLKLGGTLVTATAAELNIMDGVTSTAAELNIMDGVTSTAAELNIMDGVTTTAAEINLIDGGTSRGTTAVASGDGILINDAGTMAMTNVDTVSTYFSSHNVGGGNIVTTGALNSGSITSGFGTIDTGSSAITTTGLISGGSLDIDNVLINGTTIGHTDDTDLITVADSVLTVDGDVVITGTTPKITVGDGGTEDTLIVFDGNAADFRIGLDDGTDTLEIGGGAAHGSAAGISMDVNGDMTLGGGIACADEVIGRPRFTDYAETLNALGDVGGGTDAIDLTAGNVVSATVSTGTQTFTFTNPPADAIAGSFTLFLTNGGSQTVNWPGTVDWAGGSAPSLTSSGVDVLTFTPLDAGTIWYGFAAGLDMG